VFLSEKKLFSYLLKGSIDFSEVYGVLQKLGVKIQRFELTLLLEKHDKNKDQRLTKEEFEEVMLTYCFFFKFSFV